ncbi:MAG: hypothetical protein M1822_006924 [Bathelium mastoideum]|nr:MAG: hypothetical protein M1822_006924 [Bathelium mastoideum]
MGQFWASWVLWEKLCFILACGIIVALVLGAFKLAYSHWRIRKYSRVAAGKREGLPAPLIPLRNTRDGEIEIPFGIRAIEQGIEVEGVYISRPNTPASSPTQSRLSLRAEPATTTDMIASDTSEQAQSQIEPVAAIMVPPMQWLQSKNDDALSSKFSFERGSTPEHLQTPSIMSLASAQYDSSSDLRIGIAVSPDDAQEPPRVLVIGSSDDTLRQHEYEGPRSHGLGLMQEEPERKVGLVAGPNDASSKHRSSNESQQTGRSATDSEGSRGRQELRPTLLPRDSKSASRVSTISLESPSDFESMNAHRLSHAAETGQLTPRLQRNVASFGRTSRASFSSTEEPTDYFSAKARPASSGRQSNPRYEFASGFQLPSRIIEAHLAVSAPAMSAPAGITTTETLEGQQTVGGTESNATAIATRRTTSDSIVPHVALGDQTANLMGHPSQQQDDVLQAPPQAFEPGSRQRVVRKVNSGFFILKPGTFSKPQASEQIPAEQPPRKLQKKRRSSAESGREKSFVVEREPQTDRAQSEQGWRDTSKEKRNSRQGWRFSMESESGRIEKKLQKKRPTEKESTFTELL